MPKIISVNNDIITYEYVEGEPGFENVDLENFGKIIRALHELKIENASKIDTGIDWLRKQANDNLQTEGIALELDHTTAGLTEGAKVIVHGEITDLVVDKSGKITILDWDEAGLGSKYQDIGYVYYQCIERRGGEKDFDVFLKGYADQDLQREKILSMAGLIAIAYSRWGNKDFRIEFGMSLLKKI